MNHEGTKFKWWGYLHTNGCIQVKRFFDRRDIDEALESHFVRNTVGPFLAANREDAIKIAKKMWGG